MRGKRTALSRVRFHRVFTSYLVISLIPLLLGLVVFQQAIDKLEDSVYRFHRQLLEEYRQVTDAKLAGVQNTVMRLTWDDKVMDMGRAGRILVDPGVTFVLPEVTNRLEKIVTLESEYLDILVYASASDTVATSQYGFVRWDRFYDVFFAAEGMDSAAFQAFLRKQKTIRFLPMSIRRFTGGRWISQEVLLHTMDFPIAGAPMGKVAALISLDKLTAPMQKLTAQGVDGMLILDASGGQIAVAGTLPASELEALGKRALEMVPGIPEILTMDGRRTLAIMEPSQALDFRYVSFVEYENLFGVVLAVRNAMYILLGISTLLIIGSAAFFARRQTRQFNHLALKTDDMEHWLDTQKAALGDVFLDKLLRDEFADVRQMAEFCRRIDLPELTGSVGVLVVRFDVLAHETDARQRIDLGKLLLQNMVAERGIPRYRGNVDDQKLVLILGGFADADAFLLALSSLFGQVPAQIEAKLALEVTAVAANRLVDLMDASEVFRQCASELDYTQGPALVTLQAERGRLDEMWYPLSQEELILSSVRKGSTAQLAAALDRVYAENWDQRKLTLPTHQQLIASLRGTAWRCLQVCDDPTMETEPLRHELAAIGEHGSVSLYFDQLRHVLARLCEAVRGAHARKGNRQIEAVMRFIDENQADSSLSLSMVARHFGFSEPYLSRIFKETAQVNYSEYLEKRRVERACDLLSQGVPIQEVARQVGYNSVPVFRNAFKRVTGTTPGTFQK